MRCVYLTSLCIMLAFSPAVAQPQPVCNLTVSAETISLDELLFVKFTIENSQNGKFTPPDWKSAGWQVHSSSQSSSISISGGATLASATYQYQLVAQDTGWIEIPAATLRSHQVEITTAPKRIYVRPAKDGTTSRPIQPERRTLPPEDPKKKIKTIRL